MAGEDVAIEAEVERRLFDYVGKQGYDGQLIGHMQEKGHNKALRKWGVCLEFLPEEGEHYHKIETSSWIGRQVENFSRIFSFFKSKKTKPDPHQVEALNMTDRILDEARQYLKKMVKKEDTDFNTAYVQELLRILDKKITEECNAVKDHLIMTPEYRLEIYLTACGYAVPKFEMMRDSFRELNDPRLYLERNIKGPLFARFENQYYRTAAEEAIANTLCSHLEEPIRKQIVKKIGNDMKIIMRQSDERHFSSKMALKVKVLIDINHEKEKEEFKEVMYYVKNIKACLEKWIKYYTILYCDEIESGANSRLQNKAKEIVATMINVVKDQLNKLNETDVKKLLSAFCGDKKIKEQLGVDFEPGDFLATNGDESLQELNLDNFKNNIKAGLKKLLEKLEASFDHIKYETEMIRWQDKPHELLGAELIGCTAECPFCGEQCDRQLSDHTGVKHKVDVHRSTCLIGYRYEDTQKMVTHFCPTEVSDKSARFRDRETNFTYHYFKDYASIPAYSNWSILPDAPCEDSKYWKKFIYTYNKDLAEKYGAKPADIPRDWSGITRSEVEKNLKEVYHL